MPLVALAPDLLFMYCFVPLGVIAVLAGLCLAVWKSDPMKRWMFLLIAGLGFGGTGGFGPSFLTTYGDFLEKVAKLDPNSEEGKAEYKKLADDVAAGKVDEKYAPIAKAVLKESAGSDAQSVIDASLARATDKGRPALEQVKRDLDRRSHVAALEASGAAAAPVTVPPNVDYDGLKTDTIRDLNTRSDADLRKLSIDPAKLRRAATDRLRPTLPHQ